MAQIMRLAEERCAATFTSIRLLPIDSHSKKNLHEGRFEETLANT